LKKGGNEWRKEENKNQVRKKEGRKEREEERERSTPSKTYGYNFDDAGSGSVLTGWAGVVGSARLTASVS